MNAHRRKAVRALAAAVVLPLAAGASLLHAQTADKQLRIGILSSGTLENRGDLDRALVQGLRDQGYVEGRNLVIERRYGASRIVDNAKELGALNLDAIMTTCTPSTRVMKDVTTTTPIVMAAVSDPIRQNIIASYAKPGGNVTGTSSQAEDLLAKRLEHIVALLPGVTTVAVLANRRNPVHPLEWDQLERLSGPMGLKLVRLEIQSGDELAAAMDAAAAAKVGALLVLPDDPLMFNLKPQIVELATRQRLPDFHWAREFVESGGLMSYGESLRGSYRNVAMYIGKIKKGAAPSSLPVELPTRFELVINAKTAKALGVSVPQAMLVSADYVVQ